MKKFWTAAFCLACSIRGHADILDVIPRFAAKQRIELEISQSREDSAYKAGNLRNATPVTVLVKAVDENGIELEVTSGQTQQDGDQVAPLGALMNRGLKGVPIQVRLTPSGQLQQVYGLDAASAVFMKNRDEAVSEIADGIQNATERKAFLDSASKVVSFQNLVRTLAQELGVWLGLSGLALDTAKPVKMKSVVPHPIDVGRIAAELEVSVKDLSIERKELAVESRQSYDSNGFAGMIRLILQQSGVPYRGEGKIPDVDMVDSYEYLIDTDRALPKRAVRIRTTVIAPLLKRVDTISVVVKSFN
jgi:hypothetical protein